MTLPKLTLHALLFATTVMAAATASAQVDTEAPLQIGFGKFTQESNLYLSISGTQTYRNQTRAITTAISWTQDDPYQPTKIQLDVVQSVDNVPVQRLLADGSNFYAYNYQTHEFAAMNYGGYQGQTPSDFRDKLLAMATKSASGQAAFGLRFLRNTISGYSTWVPGVTVQELPQGVYNDPVLSWRHYVVTDSDNYLMYDSSPKRTVVFELQKSDTSEDRDLVAVYLNQLEKVGGLDRENEWTLVPTAGSAFDPAIFVPHTATELRGWRSVTSPSSVSIG